MDIRVLEDILRVGGYDRSIKRHEKVYQGCPWVGKAVVSSKSDGHMFRVC